VFFFFFFGMTDLHQTLCPSFIHDFWNLVRITQHHGKQSLARRITV